MTTSVEVQVKVAHFSGLDPAVANFQSRTAPVTHLTGSKAKLSDQLDLFLYEVARALDGKDRHACGRTAPEESTLNRAPSDANRSVRMIVWLTAHKEARPHPVGLLCVQRPSSPQQLRGVSKAMILAGLRRSVSVTTQSANWRIWSGSQPGGMTIAAVHALASDGPTCIL